MSWPAEVTASTAALLVGTSFLTSLLTAALGLGGGVLMLAILASLLPPPFVVPLHALVQIGSNCGRAVLLWRHVATPLVLRFAAGTLFGVTLGSLVVLRLPEDGLRLVLGLFVLWSCFGGRPRFWATDPTLLPLVGVATGFLTMFVGASGPFVAAFFDPLRLGRKRVVATHAACMTVEHTLKALAFSLAGFSFLAWLPLLALMIAAGFLGTLLGRRILARTDDYRFARMFRLVLALLALRLLWQAGTGLVAA
ncbi:hypothetical protein HRbin40_00331 [bacterium HR40]|nr:hypothetical protein HRbin40_00331 [bacterium HR40]